jgi:hypothetical protein
VIMLMASAPTSIYVQHRLAWCKSGALAVCVCSSLNMVELSACANSCMCGQLHTCCSLSYSHASCRHSCAGCCRWPAHTTARRPSRSCISKYGALCVTKRVTRCFSSAAGAQQDCMVCCAGPRNIHYKATCPQATLCGLPHIALGCK